MTAVAARTGDALAAADRALAGAGTAVWLRTPAGQWSWYLGGERPSGASIGPDSRFHLCSLSKAFTALATVLGVRDGLYRLDDPIVDWVPELVFDDPWITEHCSIRDLLTMRTGLSRDGLAEWGFDPLQPRERRLARVRHSGRARPFRDSYTYANPGYVALSLLVERACGRRFDEVIAAHVTGPLALRGAHLAVGLDVPARFDPWLRRDGGWQRGGETTGPSSWGSARMFATLGDLALWLDFWLGLSAGSSPPLAPRDLLVAMLQPGAFSRDKPAKQPWDAAAWTAYCMGWELTLLGGRPLYQHDGAVPGCAAKACFLPADGVAVAVLGSDSIDTLAIRNLVLQQALGLPEHDWPAWSSARRETALRQRRDGLASELAATPPGARRTDPDALAGAYDGGANGVAEVHRDPAGLRIHFRDSPMFDSRLVSRADAAFDLDVADGALGPEDGEPRPVALFTDGDAQAATLTLPGLGSFRRVD